MKSFVEDRAFYNISSPGNPPGKSPPVLLQWLPPNATSTPVEFTLIELGFRAVIFCFIKHSRNSCRERLRNVGRRNSTRVDEGEERAEVLKAMKNARHTSRSGERG